MENNSDANDALAEVAAARQQLAEKLYTPWWYHPVLGLLLGLLILQIGGILGRSGMFLMPVPVLAIIALGRIYRRLSGVDLYGPDSPDGGQRGRSLLATYVSALIVCFAGAFVVSDQFNLEWAAWALAVLVTAGTIIVGRVYDSLLRTQLRESAR